MVKLPFKNVPQRWLAAIREINQKYREPRIKMTEGVKLALLVLRIYLFVMIGLMIYSFIRALK